MLRRALAQGGIAVGAVVPLLLTAIAAGGPAAARAAHGAPHAAAPGGPYDKRPVAMGSGGAVASADLDASRAGIQVLKRGGNAVDAAVAVAATLGVTEPYVAGPGGGGFMVVYLAKQHRVVTIDGRESCPSGCTTRLFIDPETGKPLPFEEARHSGLSVGVPGMVATWDSAARRYGRRTLARDLRPAIQRARQGFRVDEAFREQTQESLADLQAFTSSRKLFLTEDGQPLPVGTVLRNPDLARTYSLIARHGADYFYQGPIGAAVADTAAHPPVWPGTPLTVRPGIMRASDVRAYRVRHDPPTHVRYRGYDVYGMAPPSSGGSTVGEALNILSGYDLGDEPRAEALFHYLEASRYSFADRNAYVGDPRFVDVPLDGLLSEEFAATRRCHIGAKAATSPVPPGDPFPPYTGCSSSDVEAPPGHEGTSTNNIVTMDRWGNVVSYTNTIEQIAGSGMTVPGYGFLLNNEMTDFTFAPPAPDAYDPNLPAAGKIPRSSMAPTVVLRDGRPAFALGSPGGTTIITTVLQVIVDRVDFGMSLPDAITAPRVSQRNTPTSIAEPEFYDSAVRTALEQRYGEKFTELSGPLEFDRHIGNATGVELLGDGLMRAAAEPVRRGGGSALVVHPAHRTP